MNVINKLLAAGLGTPRLTDIGRCYVGTRRDVHKDLYGGRERETERGIDVLSSRGLRPYAVAIAGQAAK